MRTLIFLMWINLLDSPLLARSCYPVSVDREDFCRFGLCSEGFICGQARKQGWLLVMRGGEFPLMKTEALACSYVAYVPFNTLFWNVPRWGKITLKRGLGGSESNAETVLSYTEDHESGYYGKFLKIEGELTSEALLHFDCQ